MEDSFTTLFGVIALHVIAVGILALGLMLRGRKENKE